MILTESVEIGDLRAYHAWPAEGEPRAERDRRPRAVRRDRARPRRVRAAGGDRAGRARPRLHPRRRAAAQRRRARPRLRVARTRLTRDQVLADAHAAADFLGGEVALLGLSLGGHIAYLAATELPATHLIALYPGWLTNTDIGLSRPEPTITLTPKITARTLILIGDADHAVSGEERTVVERALTDAGVEHEVVVYPGVPHGFLCDRRDTYDAAAAADAWERIDAFLG